MGRASFLSLGFKIIGCLVILTALVFKGFQVWDTPMSEVVVGVLAIEALVLPIDISKIKESK